MLNPITYTEQVVGDFLRYQLTTYPFADAVLHAQMRRLLDLEHTRRTPLLQGPYVSLSQAFEQGAAVEALIKKGVLHPHLKNLTNYAHVYGHQQRAMEAIHRGKTTLVATGTGSGKTECFLYPIVSHALRLRDESAASGIMAVLVYPMNALAEDQLGRMRELLAGSGVTFGMYVGKTPENVADVTGKRLPAGSTHADYLNAIAKARAEGESYAVHPAEECVSREEMRAPGKHPRILLTNVKQLELLLTRQRDVELFDDSDLRFLVFDEAHTFSGAQGGETACLIRRLRRFCGKSPDDVVCVATSATIADPERGVEAGRDFAARFFGIDPKRVELVGESYERDAWAAKRTVPSALPGDAGVQLQTVLEVVREVERDPVPPEAAKQLQRMFQSLTGQKIDAAKWQESLYDRLSENELAFQIAEALRAPRPLSELVAELTKRIGRAVPEEEVLVWLALGATARKEGRPLMRPVVHGFVRGMAGAVVTFPAGQSGAQLWLSREDALRGDTETESTRKLDVSTCTTCGQHYFVHHAEDFTFTDRLPAGGRAEGDEGYWPALDEANGGKRLVLTNGLVGADEEADDADGDDSDDGPPPRTAFVYLCRACGSLHRRQGDTCRQCGRAGEFVQLLAVQQRDDNEGYLTRCLSCGANGRRFGATYREPARPVRAVTVSDVHVLAQNMLQHAEHRRLIVFADNRQDAAFQAGWMQDHARRYRLRALMYERIKTSAVSVGDLTAWLDHQLDADDSLSRALVPEVWRVAPKEAAGTTHADERKYFLRIQVLREVTNGLRQRIGLEPWGRMRLRYLGMDPALPFFQRWAHVARCSPDELCDAAATLLDIARRSTVLLDRHREIFTRWWGDGDREIQRGYLAPIQGGPKAMVLERDGSQAGRLRQWLSTRGQTRAVQLAKKWQIPDEQIRPFLEELWALVTDELKLVVPVTLKNQWNNALRGTQGARQIDGDRLVLEPHAGLYRCGTCRRMQLRAGPHAACIQWRCEGEVRFVKEDPDDYDLKVLDEQFALVRAREHSAQVPNEERELLERAFKGTSELVNTLVATPTLELGVDIGALDAVLMRNVPPLAANYWQRAGRAGRRHRMAVNLTYASARSHDRAYFQDPLKLLDGRIDPPRFNLKNEQMVRKHVHAAVLSELHQLSRPARGLSDAEREAIGMALAHAFPPHVKGYLFRETGEPRRDPFDLSPFSQVLERHSADLREHVEGAFTGCWPEEDRDVVQPESLRQYVVDMPARLAEVITRLDRRLQWALEQLRRLRAVADRQGTLDPAEKALRTRCERLVDRLKGNERRRRSEAEGYDDTLTYGVLAAEGFLPGYGLDSGSVLAYHQAPRYATHLRDFWFRRGLAMALREYSPGNYLYANGHRFYPRFYHLEAINQGGTIEPLLVQVDIANEAITEHGVAAEQVASLGPELLHVVPICDVDLPHQSHIADDEDYRFQLSVAIFGHERDRHGGGRGFRWGHRDVLHRRQVHLRLVNVGANRLVRDGRFGYPVCLVCGQSRSPFASQAERDNFEQTHQERCGQPVLPVGFYADDVADALALVDCTDRKEAYSLLEALRMGAADVLEMEREDLQILVIGQPGSEQVNGLLFDPMSGGSGLLDQMVARWDEVVASARRITAECPSQCAVSCVDCLQHYRNSWSHAYLDRHVAAESIDAWGEQLSFSHHVPPKLPAVIAGPLPVNDAEALLEAMLDKAGMPAPERQHAIDLGMPLGTTTADFFYEDPADRTEGLCIYLDGLSAGIHGNPEAQRRDARIREELRSREYEVLVIAASHLTDKDEMVRHLRRVARFLIGGAKAKEVQDDTSWFADARGSQPPDASAETVDGWSEILDLVDDGWRPLLEGLRAADLEAPDDADWEIAIDGRVSDHKAIVVWRPGPASVALVDESMDAHVAGVVRVGREDAPAEVAASVRELLAARAGGSS